MRIDVQKPLFAWQCLEDHPALVTIRRLLECIPDGRLLESLRGARGRGRNDYPVRVLWRVVLLSIILRHKDVEACLGDLQRNPTLQEIVGIESPEQIPHGWNVSRFLETLGQEPHRSLLHEVSLAYQVSSAKAGDNEVLPSLVDQALGNLPPARIKTLAYDKAADDIKVHQKLHQAGIHPVIQNRSLWKDEQEQMLPGHDGNSNIVYDEGGTLHCYDRASAPMVRHRMSYIGHEPSRGTLKHRCPAMHEAWTCPMSPQCNAGKTYGLTVRVKQEIDLRRFPAIPRATKQFERLYKERPAVERVNARLKIFWGVDDGNVTGGARFHALVGTAMIVHEAFATVLASLPRREGTLGKMRLSPIAKAIAAQIRGEESAPQPPPRQKRRRSSEKQSRLFR